MESTDTTSRLSPHFRRTVPVETDARAVLFDLCGVLYDDSPWKRWLLQLLTRLGIHSQYTSFFRVWEREYLSAVRRGDLSFWEALRRFLRATGLTRAQIDEVEAAAHARYRYFEGRVHAVPGAAATLSRLRACGIPLGVLSFSISSADELRAKLVQMGLERFFPHTGVWCREDEDDPVARFHRAAADLGVLHPHLVFVGRDTLQLERARQAGLATVALNHDPDAAADTYLDRIEQIVDVLSFPAARVIVG